MTKTDYEALADAILSALNQSNTNEQLLGVELTAGYIADKLGADNPRFNRVRFMRAAGLMVTP